MRQINRTTFDTSFLPPGKSAPTEGFDNIIGDTATDYEDYVKQHASLDDIKREKALQVDACKYEKLQVLTLSDGKQVQADLASLTFVAIVQGTDQFPIDFILADNTIFQLTAENSKAFFNEITDETAAIVLSARTHKDALLALTDRQQVIDYNPDFTVNKISRA